MEDLAAKFYAQSSIVTYSAPQGCLGASVRFTAHSNNFDTQFARKASPRIVGWRGVASGKAVSSGTKRHTRLVPACLQ